MRRLPRIWSDLRSGSVRKVVAQQLASSLVGRVGVVGILKELSIIINGEA